jgi:hypothetical protein
MEKNKQHTAVDWLIIEIVDLYNHIKDFNINNREHRKLIMNALKKSKEIEKEQIIEAFEIGIQSEFFHQTFNAPCKDGEQYYTETYKQ